MGHKTNSSSSSFLLVKVQQSLINVDTDVDTDKSVNSLRQLFTIYSNQLCKHVNVILFIYVEWPDILLCEGLHSIFMRHVILFH